MHTWHQTYNPAGSLALSSLIALIPIVFFFVALAALKMKGYVAGTLTLALSLLIAIFVYRMPAGMALASAGYGFLFGLWPIAWLIINALFLFQVTVRTGQFDVIRSSVASLTRDHRLQMLLVGFGFGAFLEGATGGGAPVAITTALLAGLGMHPLYAAGLCLITNTAPVAFGSMGIPIMVAAQTTGMDPFVIGQVAGRQVPLLSLLIPFWVVLAMDGVRGVRDTWPAILVCGGSFATTQYLTANFIGPALPDITAALVSLATLAVFLRFWQPARVFRFTEQETGVALEQHALPAVMKAWTPFLILTVFVVIWTWKPFENLFKPGAVLDFLVLRLPVPMLDQAVQKLPPISAAAETLKAVYVFNPLDATGTAVFLAAVVNVLLLKMKPAQAAKAFRETVISLRWPIYSIGVVLAFAFVVNYSGQSSTLALLLAGTGFAFPFFSPLLGWLGVFLTGSDTSSNALFCNLQATTAHQIGVSDVLLVTANTTGGVTGKMISPQSIAIACASVGLAGRESELFRFTFLHSLALVAIVGLITMAQAYLVPWMLP